MDAPLSVKRTTAQLRLPGERGWTVTTEVGIRHEIEGGKAAMSDVQHTGNRNQGSPMYYASVPYMKKLGQIH